MFLSVLLYIVIHHSNVVSHTTGKVIQHCRSEGNSHFIQLQLKNKNKQRQINGFTFTNVLLGLYTYSFKEHSWTPSEKLILIFNSF